MVTLLTKGNSKLGDIWTFNLEAIATCPGRSELCESICYADRYSKQYTACVSLYQSNFKYATSKEFVKLVAEQLHNMRKLPKAIRIHASGDFFSSKYIRDWISLIHLFPDVRFYAYTRSWTVKRMHKAIRDLADLDNMTLWMSTDKTMDSIPKLFKDLKVAYLSESYAEEKTKTFQRQAAKSDLIFRRLRKNLMFNASYGNKKAIVCPKETGRDTPVAFKCATCEICF